MDSFSQQQGSPWAEVVEWYSVLHYIGYDDDRGGIVSVVRALAATGRSECVLGLNRGAVQSRVPALPVMEFSPMAGETISLGALWRARVVASEVRRWLAVDARRVFHGHSRAGLLVGLWLSWWGEKRVVVSVHCYGRHQWFYRWAARQLGDSLYWLTPAMKRHYGIASEGWAQCMPSCVAGAWREIKRERSGSRLCIGGVGTLVAWKGWHLVVEALRKLPAETRAKVRFEHIGGMENEASSRAYAEKLKTMTAQAGIADVIHWRGVEATSARLLSEVDVVVIASDAEPFSMVRLEALQAGVPVLASRAGGPMDVISPPVNGWFFESGDAADLARVLAQLADTAERENVRIDSDGLKRFSADIVAAQWTEIYESCVKRATAACSRSANIAQA